MEENTTTIATTLSQYCQSCVVCGEITKLSDYPIPLTPETILCQECRDAILYARALLKKDLTFSEI